jgi:hypothetical protein
MTTTVTMNQAKVAAAVLPVCEVLEKRALLAGNTVVDGGMLTVYGTDGDDTIVVTVDSSSTVSVMLNGASAGTFAGVTGLRVSARGGNDAVDVSGGMSAVLVGGDGADTLRGGDGADVMFGSAGDDVLVGNYGGDILIGGEGIDTFDGGMGFNILSLDVLSENWLEGESDGAEDMIDDPGFALDPAPEPEPEPTPEPEPVDCGPGLKLGHYKNGKLCTTPPAAGCFKKVA